MNTTVDGFELRLEGTIYDEVHGTLIMEVRDLGEPARTLTITTVIDGEQMVSTHVSWDKFTEAFDGMRSRMMGEDWDDALVALIGRSDSHS